METTKTVTVSDIQSQNETLTPDKRKSSDAILVLNAPVRRPTFNPVTGELDERSKRERRNRFAACCNMLFDTDLSKVPDEYCSALYQGVTQGMFGIPDEDGSLAFGKRASKNPRENIDMLRRFVKGEYTLIEDPEYTKWREMDEEAKFKYALEKESWGNMAKSKLKGERGTSPLRVVGNAIESVAALEASPGAFSGLLKLAGGDSQIYDTLAAKQRERTERHLSDSAKLHYENLSDEEKAAYRADVIRDYDEKLSRRQTLATFLQYSQDLSDTASYLLAKSFNQNQLDVDNIQGLDEEERDRVYSAFSLMRGDQKKGRILGIQTDFTDDTFWNRAQLALYGLQQSVLGLGIDAAEFAKNVDMAIYAKCALDEDERKLFFKEWDARVRADQAMKQGLPEADGFWGSLVQGVAENSHWIIPYSMIGKGGKMVTAARGLKQVEDVGVKAKLLRPLKDVVTTIKPMRLGGDLHAEKAVYEASKAAMESAAAATKAAYTLDINGVKKLGEYGSALLSRQLAAVDRYTQLLQGVNQDLKAAKWWKDASGTAMWAIGEASAFSAFAQEYIANADAAGISREESVLTAAVVGMINAQIERLYIPGMESSLSPAQLKSMMWGSALQAMHSDGAAGFRKWIGNRFRKDIPEIVKVSITEGPVEEVLQQLVQEHAKSFDKMCADLRASGEASFANFDAAALLSLLPTAEDWATFIDTAADSLPTSIGFGLTSVARQKARQHLHNVWTRHANRRAGSNSTMLTAGTIEELYGAVDYNAGIVDMVQNAVNIRKTVEKQWADAKKDDPNPHRFEEAITSARRAWRNPQTGDVIQEVADAAGVDVKTAEVLAQYFQTEAEAVAFSPQARAWTSLNMSLADIDEETIKTILSGGYVEGSFASDPENGIYSGRVKLDDGTERTIAYRVGDFSEELRAEADENAKVGSAFGDSFNERHEELGDGIRWEMLSDAQRYQEALFASNAAQMGSGVFELTDSKGRKVRVNADSVIRLANGHIADIGYGPAATQATVRHETFHSLWQFVRGTLADADVQQLAKTMGVDVTADNWERKLDERMAHEMERYASGHYVSHAVSSRFDKMLSSWAGKIINFFGKFSPSDEVTDPKTGKPYQLKGLYDAILRGELGSGVLGVELRKVPAQPSSYGDQGEAPSVAKSTLPVPVTDADRAAAEEELRGEAGKETQATEGTEETPTVASVPVVASVPAATAEHPADAATPNQRFYKVGLPNSNVKLVGRLEVRDVDTGIITSTDADYHDRGNQNRDDKSEESRALVEKIGANPDPLQIGTVQPMANNGIVWMLPNGDVIIGNHRVNGVRKAYEKGTAGELEKFVREDAAKRGIEIGADVKKPLTVFILERIETPDGKADVHEVVRLANESQNRGFNIREQASNDAKILTDNNLLPRMAFRADGRIDETKSGDAIGKFRQESGAQGLVAEDGSLTEEGQTRIQNAALAVLLGGEGNNALLQKIMTNAGRLDMLSELRALMKMTPELMALAEAKPAYDLRAPLAEALQLFTEWRDKDETARVEKGKTRHDWRETKDGHRIRGLSWESFMSQGDMFRTPSEEAKILGDLFAKAESLRSFDREDVESAAGKKRVIDLISDYLTDYIANARAVNTETDDMFGGTPASIAEILAVQRAKPGAGSQERFSVAAPIERRKDLIAFHNVSAAGLRGMDELGGLAVPSFAVTKDTIGGDEFGEISLLVRPQTIDPKRKGNKIYSNDAWTPTFPETKLKIDGKTVDRMQDRLFPIFRNPANAMWSNIVSWSAEIAHDNIDDWVNRFDGDAVAALRDRDAYKVAYLAESGKLPAMPTSTGKLFKSRRGMFSPQGIVAWIDNDAVAALSERLGDRLLPGGESPSYEECKAFAADTALQKEIADVIDSIPARKEFLESGEEPLSETLAKTPMSVIDFRDIADAIYNYRNGGVKQVPDRVKAIEALNAAIDADKAGYEKWLGELSRGITDGKRYIRNSRDIFTPSGNRRSFSQLYDPLTLAAAVKAMLKSQESQGNGLFGRNPFGVAAMQYKSLDAVIADEGRLQKLPREQVKANKEALTKRLEDIVAEYNATQKSPDENPYTQFDRAADMMLDSYAAARGNKTRLAKELNSWGYTASNELVDRFMDVMKDMASMPEDYFEAKAYRAVGFDEIAAAIVPDDASAETNDILSRNGVAAYTYKSGDSQDRIRAVNAAADAVGGVRFSVSPVYTGTAADYANLSRQGGVDDGPSLLKIGTGEGSQVYGWGLYGSKRRGVAESYARKDVRKKKETYFHKKEWYERTHGRTVLLDGQKFEPDFFTPLGQALVHLTASELSVDELIRELRVIERDHFGGETYKAMADALEENKSRISFRKDIVPEPPHEHIYEQTFFTDRAPGDESHLLKWYEPVSKEQKQWILKEAFSETAGFEAPVHSQNVIEERFAREDLNLKGEDVYVLIEHELGSPKAASEFLARAGIDGVKYPVDSYGKTVKDGDKAGWNYVSFRDDNIRVDHKWTDGQMRYSIAQTPTGEKFVLLDRPNQIDWNDRNKVREYLTTLVGSGAVSLADNQRIEIGKELPKEWTRSSYAEKVFRNKRLTKVKAKTAQHLDELIVASGTRTSEPVRDKERENGVYYRRKVKFGVAGHDTSRGYSGELVSYTENGEEMLYDLVQINDDSSLTAELNRDGHGGYEILSANHEGSEVPEGTAKIIPNTPAGSQERFSVSAPLVEAMRRQEFESRLPDVPKDTVRLLHVGDWYMTGGTDAQLSAPLLNTPLVERQGVPQVWVRDDNIDMALAKIVRNGKSVALCERGKDGNFIVLRTIDAGPRYSVASRAFDWKSLADMHGTVVSSTSVAHLEQAKFKDERKAYRNLKDAGRLDEAKSLAEKFASDERTKWLGKFLLAKNHGDTRAAADVVEHVMKPEAVEELRNVLDRKRRIAVLMPMYNKEGDDYNRLPFAYANALATALDNTRVEAGLFKVSLEHNTNATTADRINRDFAFETDDIDLSDNPQIVLVDDTWTSGQTLASALDAILKEYPNAEVVAMTTLATGRYGKNIKPTNEQLTSVLEKSRIPSIEYLNDTLGFDIRKATGSELQLYRLTGRQGIEGIRALFKKMDSGAVGGNSKAEGGRQKDNGGTRGLPEGEGAGRYSVEASQPRSPYPQLRGMSDEELLSAALAVDTALGKSDKPLSSAIKIRVAKNMVRRLYPHWSDKDISIKAYEVITNAHKLAKNLREDISRGVSESLILRYLPQNAINQFGTEMRSQARRGKSLGEFGQKVSQEINDRRVRVIEDAVRVQTGIDANAIENIYGINLSETIMHLAENSFSHPPESGSVVALGDGAAQTLDETGQEEETAKIDAKVKAVVDDIVASSGQQADDDIEKRKNRKTERAGENVDSKEGEDGSAPGDFPSGDGDALAAAVAKEALNLENPRHLARFVEELARRAWIEEHNLAKDADVWRDLVAVQFLRKTAQSVYSKLVRDLTYSRSRDTAMQRIIKLENIPTVAGIVSEMEFIGALINAQRIRDTQKAMCEKLDLFLRQEFSAQGRFKPDKEEGKRKVSAEAELRARYMRKCMWFTPDAAADEARQLQETLDALSVDFKDAGRDRDQSREFVETIRKLNVLREFGALRYKPVGEIEAAAQWWEDFARGESDDIVREMSDRDIRTKEAAHLLAVAFADPKRTIIREGGKADALNRFITGHMGFISLLQDCMRHASDADAAAVKDIIDYISREIQKSGDRSEAEKRRHNDAFHAAVEGIYGRKFNAVMKDMMAPDERFTKFMGVVGGKRVTPTKGRALQLLVSLLQEGRKVQVEDEENPGQTKTVWEGGYHDNIVKHHREGQAAEIMRLLDPADMNMLKWLGQWYESNRADLSGVCHSLFGIGVYAELPNYFPVKMMLETQGLEKGNGVGWTIFPKALTPRVRNERDFDTSADIFSMWASRMEEAAQWKHHAQLGLEMRGIFGRAELREAVRANHGASVDELMQGFITDILAGHGAYDRSTAGVQYFSDQIRGWTALCALGGNVGVMFKQTTSIPAFGFEIGLVNTAKYMVNAFTPEGMAAMRRIWDSEQRKTRWQVGSSEVVRNALNQQGAGALKRMFQASMITNKLGDAVPALVIGQGIYRDCLARGMSDEDAMAETWSLVERTQQSGRMENQTSIQRRNKLGRIMFQFLSTQQQYLQYELRAIREVIARPDSVKRWGSLGRAILLNHFILSSAYYWMGQLYKYALGQEPPEDELKDWIVTCLLGPYGSLFVAGFCCKYTLERAIKGYSIKGGSSMLPMESWLKNQVNDGAKLVEAIFDSDGDTWDNMLEAAGRWMSDSNSVVRDLRKIYRYRVKGEKQKK